MRLAEVTAPCVPAIFRTAAAEKPQSKVCAPAAQSILHIAVWDQIVYQQRAQLVTDELMGLGQVVRHYFPNLVNCFSGAVHVVPG